MVLELLGNNKLAYYIDPGFRGDQWFRDVKKLKNYRITSYKKLKKIILRSEKYRIASKDYFCINSKNTSKLIFKNLNKMENFFKKNNLKDN